MVLNACVLGFKIHICLDLSSLYPYDSASSEEINIYQLPVLNFQIRLALIHLSLLSDAVVFNHFPNSSLCLKLEFGSFLGFSSFLTSSR